MLSSDLAHSRKAFGTTDFVFFAPIKSCCLLPPALAADLGSLVPLVLDGVSFFLPSRDHIKSPPDGFFFSVTFQ